MQVLITVKAAPNPSEKYGETVCVAGLSLDHDRPGWIRLYPINFRELGPDASFAKYDVVSVEAVPARQDSRQESWRPRMPTLKVGKHLTKWSHRRPWIDPAISEHTTMCRLVRGATMSTQSLALIRPKRITGPANYPASGLVEGAASQDRQLCRPARSVRERGPDAATSAAVRRHLSLRVRRARLQRPQAGVH
ncbi:hypothetical protein [Amycolatopsis keratiniphila]|uniref:hypothetical protein n=1 Tax=Amycolatopsis keratiniphila TaxID=129921 RepID=UPI000A9CF7B7|nr:hypothetical protein [Amycolatopsis keratiniphila]